MVIVADRLLRRDRLRDPPDDAAGDGVGQRRALLALDLLGQRAAGPAGACRWCCAFIKPDRPPKPLPLRIDWIGVTLFAAWIVSLPVHLRLVSQVGRLDVQRLHGDGDCSAIAVAARRSSPGSARASP